MRRRQQVQTSGEGELYKASREWGLDPNGNNNWWNIAKNTLSRTGYDLWNVASLGTLAQEDENLGRYGRGEITYEEFREQSRKIEAVAAVKIVSLVVTGGVASAAAESTLLVRVAVGAATATTDQFIGETAEIQAGLRTEYSSAKSYLFTGTTGGVLGGATRGRANAAFNQEGRITLKSELQALKSEVADYGRRASNFGRRFGEGYRAFKPSGTYMGTGGGGLQGELEKVAAGLKRGIGGDDVARQPSLLDTIVDEANLVAVEGAEISAAQRTKLRENLPVVQRRNQSQNQYMRAEFERNQSRITAQWSENTGMSWPQGATPHHIIPLESGGSNKWWNFVPTYGASPNHALPGIPGPHASGGALRRTIQRGRKALPPGTPTDLRAPE